MVVYDPSESGGRFERRVKVSDAAVGSAQRHRAVQEEIHVHYTVWLDLGRTFDFWFPFSRSVMWSDFLHLQSLSHGRVSFLNQGRSSNRSSARRRHSYSLCVYRCLYTLIDVYICLFMFIYVYRCYYSYLCCHFSHICQTEICNIKQSKAVIYLPTNQTTKQTI